MKKNYNTAVLATILTVSAGLAGPSFAGSAKQDRVSEDGTTKDEIRQIVAETMESRARPFDKLSIGGYGEVHANFIEGSSDGQSNDMLDIHRLVGFIGYEFTDWIRFQSEIEIEHAMVSSGHGGELEIEQAHLDFLLGDMANVRLGRSLVPLGLINEHHEPTTFNGVERPSFAKYIIPSTWWSDGIGLFGNLTNSLSYKAYIMGGLDGSAFDATDGIRGGRIKERPSLNDMALTARFDYFPFLDSRSADLQNLRFGASFFHGGINNGNKGEDPDINGDITIYSADFSAQAGDFDFKGVYAFEEIDGAENLDGVAEEIMGYYLEAGYHFWPEGWKRGKLANSDAVVFTRYDNYDTQYKMPAEVVADPAGDRYDWTFGLSFYPTTNVVLKADYQIHESEADSETDNSFNLGIGWQF